MKKSLILDIDNTLVSTKCTDDILFDTKNEFFITVNYRKFLITKRHGLDEFLLKISEMFDIYAYTSASQNYADLILDRLEQDINKKIFIKRFYITDCVFNGNLCKDINKLGLELDIKNTIIIDDSPHIYHKQFYNVIYIGRLSDEKETIFCDILELLKILIDEDDVQIKIKSYNEQNYPSLYNEKAIKKIFKQYLYLPKNEIKKLNIKK